MADYDVKAACEERQRRLWPTVEPIHASDGERISEVCCTCTILQAALDAGEEKGRGKEREECAVIADTFKKPQDEDWAFDLTRTDPDLISWIRNEWSIDIAKAIRARGESDG